MKPCQHISHRYLETKEDIFHYLVNYLQKHNEESISVSRISKEVKIQRHTFYHHYKNLSDLYIDFIRFVLDEMIAFMNKERIIEPEMRLGYYLDYRFMNKDMIISVLKLKQYKDFYYSSVLKEIFKFSSLSDFQSRILIHFLKEIDNDWLGQNKKLSSSSIYGFMKYVLENL